MSKVDFNPRTPCGVRLSFCSYVWRQLVFQSTHPLRGATRLPLLLINRLVRFQSTHPLRGATIVGAIADTIRHISIHAPLAGCDRHFSNNLLYSAISIHAPLAGCDLNALKSIMDFFDFNPRTPCGVRPQNLIPKCKPTTFQSTHPLRGATFLVRNRK